MNGNELILSKYPMTSEWEFTLEDDECIRGKVYCTDAASGVVVLYDPTTSDIQIVSAASVRESKQLQEASSNPAESVASDVSHTRKILEERERRAIKLAQESLRHLNPKVSKGYCFFVVVTCDISR